jgi:hypothetical protein
MRVKRSRQTLTIDAGCSKSSPPPSMLQVPTAALNARSRVVFTASPLRRHSVFTARGHRPGCRARWRQTPRPWSASIGGKWEVRMFAHIIIIIIIITIIIIMAQVPR